MIRISNQQRNLQEIIRESAIHILSKRFDSPISHKYQIMNIKYLRYFVEMRALNK